MKVGFNFGRFGSDDGTRNVSGNLAETENYVDVKTKTTKEIRGGFFVTFP